MLLSFMYLSMSLSKGINAGRLKCDIILKGLMEWVDLYGSVILVRVNTIYTRDRRIFIATAFPTRVPWFLNLKMGSKLSMILINKKDVGVTSNVVKTMLVV